MKRTVMLLLLAAGTAWAATEENLNKTFLVAPGGKLVVDVNSGSIDVQTNAAAGEVNVEVWRKITRKSKTEEEQFLRDHPVVIVHEGDTVTVRCRYNENNSLIDAWKNRNEGKYTIRVPARFSAKLTTSGGAIAVSDLSGEVKADTSGGALRFVRVLGPLTAATSGGGVRVNDCEGTIKVNTSGGGIEVAGGGGSLNSGTSGGGVSVKNFTGPAVVGTSGGGITIENVQGAVKGSTSGGPVNVVLPAPLPGEVILSTSGGGITVKVPVTAAFSLDAETSGGGVSSDLPVAIEGKKKHDRLKGPVNGGGPLVDLHTSGGSIRVKKL